MKLNKTRQMLVDNYIKALESNRIPWKIGWETNRSCHHNPTTNTKYKGINRLLLIYISHLRQYNDPRWVTFNQIKNKGWKLIDAKGKGIPLEKWSIYDIETKKYINYNDALKIKHEESLTTTEAQRRFKWSCKTFTVFNAKHIEGIEPYKETVHLFDVNKTAKQLIENYTSSTDLAIIEGDSSQGRCFYNPKMDIIKIPKQTDFFNEYEYIASLLHECCHSTMHPKRMNREDALSNLGSIDTGYSFEELRAEIGSSFLCADIGLDISQSEVDNHSAYIQGYIQQFKEKPQTLFSAINDAKTIGDYIEEKGRFEELIKENDRIPKKSITDRKKAAFSKANKKNTKTHKDKTVIR